MSEYETILVERRGAVTLVTLNRPQALNALNSSVLKELIDVFSFNDFAKADVACVRRGYHYKDVIGTYPKKIEPFELPLN